MYYCSLQAYNLFQELRNRTTANPSFYVSMSTIESIHKQLNMPLGRGGMDRGGDIQLGNDQGDHDEIQGEAIEEEVVDDFDD